MDYEDLGFKCGVEIHQQLDTDKKLFCQCSTENVNEGADAKVKRSLRPVPGERGSVDDAAKFEYLKENDFVYNFYRDVSCLVELDEEPPHRINPEAMNTAIQFALMLDCEIPDEIHFMRKIVLDGSNTSGFQRTAMIGMEGSIETDQGEVKIPDVELEEESAGVHGKEDGKKVFDLDRLGIPLIEVGTDASIKNPEHAREVAMKIGMLLRSTGNVKRGLGTIRQDVNVSIDEGARVEIKGFQDVRNLDKLVRREVKRQKSLVELKKELKENNDFDKEFSDVSEVFESCGNSIIGSVLDGGGKVYATKLPLEGKMNRELCEGKTLGKELAGYAMAQGLNGIMHTDEEVEKYGLFEEFEKVSQHLDKKEGEVVVVVAGDEEKALNAIESVVERAEKLSEGVPEETRSANDDFTTDYSRPLPGSARMYPETDIRPFEINKEFLEDLEERIPETLEEKKERLSKEIGDQLAKQVIRSDRLSDFEKLYERDDFGKEFVANFFVNSLKDVESRYNVDTDALEVSDFEEIFELYSKDLISKDSVKEVVKHKVIDPSKDASEIVEEEDLKKSSDEEVRQVVKEVLKQKKDLIEEQGEHSRGALMGVVMKELGGGADGSLVNKVLSEELEKYLN